MFGLTLQSKLDKAIQERDQAEKKYELSKLFADAASDIAKELREVKDQVVQEIETSKDGNERASLKRILNKFS